VIAAFAVVMCFVFKKKKERKILNPQEHVYESVLQPPNTLITFSKPSEVDADLHDEVKTTSFSTATQFELTDNEAYCNSPPKPSAEDEVAPGADPE
jgi:hypothetical protein